MMELAVPSTFQMADSFGCLSTAQITLPKRFRALVLRKRNSRTSRFLRSVTSDRLRKPTSEQGCRSMRYFSGLKINPCQRSVVNDRMRGEVSFGFIPRVLSTDRFSVQSGFSFTRAVVQTGKEAELASKSGQDGETDEASFEWDEDVGYEYISQETLNLFEWPAICSQVAQFASTPMGRSISIDGNLTIGSSQAESEELLDQTTAALGLMKPLDFSGIQNLQGIVGDALSGNVCQIKDFISIRSTLVAVQRLYNQLFEPSCVSKDRRLTSLQRLLASCDLSADLVEDIENAVDCSVESILDRASPALAAARLSRKENIRALDSLLKETALWVVQQGGMDSVVITRRRARSCIAVRSSHKNLLPGGITLDVSNTGTTSFMEPEPALNLNNEEMRLAGLEKAEELAVLKRLTMKLVDKAEVIVDLMGRITVIDLACAKASHAKWLEAVRPLFHKRVHDVEAELPGAALLVDIEAIRHPLLLGSSLPKLPAGERVGQGQRPVASSDADKASPADFWRPVPVDIKVKSNVRVVTITGPNTGGKTATLKTLGVAALMAKAGIFLPAAGQPKLPWFDNVLADVGDEQSLERSLSTFSGHIRRLCSILLTSTSRSLVLLDEVGGGTDPTEGAALATAVLRHLSEKVRLCVATTHSAELKVLKDGDSRFENASVEFDIKTLKPTYKVLWGIAGQSNALDIADSLGFDKQVLGRARELLFKMKPSQLGVRTMELLVPLVKQRDEQVVRARQALQVLESAKQLHQELNSAAVNLPKRETASKRMLSQAVADDIVKCRTEVEQVIEKFQEAIDTESAQSIKEVHAEIASIVENYTVDKALNSVLDFLPPSVRNPGSNRSRNPVAEPLTVGESVFVRRLSKTPVTVVEVPLDGEYVSVQLGSLKLQVKTSEVIRKRSGGTGASSKSKQQVLDKANVVTSREGRRQASTVAAPDAQKFEVAVQTSKNTLDLRGMRVDDAVRELNMALSSKSPQSVLFVVHGLGTGAVKEAVLQALRKHPYVARFEDESMTNQGCTVVYVK
ncbi:hypothetical protein R1sor_021017 [Riccia sorocarpa]|uniref:Smr domain-containing protein n=1 Tax=Riccia sorocarpa TaxID=122646 RepID=A0ABD3GHI0_9MARC